MAGIPIVVLPRKATQTLPPPDTYTMACRIMLSSPDMMWPLLCEAGLLQAIVPEVAAKLMAFNAQHHPQFASFLNLPASENSSNSMRLFSLAAYNRLFRNTVYIFIQRPPWVEDSWQGMRCTCAAHGVHQQCEHTVYIRTYSK